MDGFKWEMTKQATATRVIQGNVMLPESKRRRSPILKRASKKACDLLSGLFLSPGSD